ncbi:MAG: DUF86 domain-containing protein [Atribacterota bacterium]
MTIDRERIVFLIGEIEKSLTVLKEFSLKGSEEIISDLKILGSIKYYLIVAIEACIDISNHIIAKEHLGVPQTYSDCFRILQENNIISNHLAQKLINMAKFRNLLVHLYWDINDKKIYEILQSELDDFKEFIKQISTAFL